MGLNYDSIIIKKYNDNNYIEWFEFMSINKHRIINEYLYGIHINLRKINK